ncbi:hypothetical protein FRB97_000975 [Tulasnella sp. 331]|nr:hypothetical protein FRB97_000975 [Tulasnella sp. 331]
MEVKSSIVRIAYAPDGESVLVLDKYSTFSRLTFQKMTSEKESTSTWSYTGDPHSKLHGATDFKFNHVGDLLFASTNSGSIACVEYPTMELVDTFNAHLGSCNTVDLDPRGGYLASGGSDSMINIFNNVEMLIHKAISETDLPVRHLTYSFDGEYLAAALAGPDLLISYRNKSSSRPSKKQRLQSASRMRRASVSSAPSSESSPFRSGSWSNASSNNMQMPLRYSRPSRPTRLSVVFENVASMWTNRQTQDVLNEVITVSEETSGGDDDGTRAWWCWLIKPKPATTTVGTGNISIPSESLSHNHSQESIGGQLFEIFGQTSSHSGRGGAATPEAVVAEPVHEGGREDVIVVASGFPFHSSPTAHGDTTTPMINISTAPALNADEGSQDSHTGTFESSNVSTSSLVSADPLSGPPSQMTLMTTPGNSSLDVCPPRLLGSPLAQSVTAADAVEEEDGDLGQVVQLNRSNTGERTDEDDEESDWEDEDDDEEEGDDEWRDIGTLQRLLPHASLPNTGRPPLKLRKKAKTIIPVASPPMPLPSPLQLKPRGPGEVFWLTKHSRWRGNSSLRHEMCFRWFEDACPSIAGVIAYQHEQERLSQEMAIAGVRNVDVVEDNEDDSVGWRESMVTAARRKETVKVGLGLVLGVVSTIKAAECLCTGECDGDCGVSVDA